MKVQLILAFLLVGTCLLAKQADQISFVTVKNDQEWDAIFKKAKSENKLVFVDVFTDWCGYCKQLDEEVYTDPKVIEYFEEHFINIKFDAESEFGEPRADQFGVSTYPTLLFLTKDQQVFQALNGFVPASALNAYGNEVQRMWSVLPELEEKLASKVISKDETLELISILETTDELRAREIAKDYIVWLTPEDYLNLETIWLLSRHENQINGTPFKYIKNNRELMIETHGINEFNDYMSAVYNDNLQLAIKYGDKQLLNGLVMEVLPEFLEASQLPRARYTTKALYFAQRGEFDDFRLEVNSYMNNHLAVSQKADFALSTTYDIIENYPSEEMYRFSSALLGQALRIDEKNFELNSIMGYTKGLIGDYKSANTFLEKAKTLAQGAEELELLNSLFEAVKMMQEGQF
ncbi:thioredoxin family protein [Roseivirga misakiensis]|uniref:Thioredoxin domain-containing protein n=1 Tax=Roseivirga misakiensis TaxID=1563681 RepID=A0A1E5T0G9_9BACT|nr:thioredoxin fold domain-containing protein [Roseivirga misakiensis]OEK04861.1 hypothetical protein BFP71_15595 [Roseivirga misakiensis]